MQGSYRSARIVQSRNLFLSRLRLGIWTVEKENRNLLIRTLSDIHRSMNAGARLLPLDLSRSDLNALAVASITVLNREGIASQDHRHSLKRIAMPRHSLAGSKAQTPHHRGSVVEEDFVNHS